MNTHRALADDRRRTVIAVLDQSPSLTLDELAAEVATIDGADIERVTLTLHHHHLPLLDDLGAIDYDPDESVIAVRRAVVAELSEVVERFNERVETNRDGAPV